MPSVKAAWYADVRRAGAVGRNVFWPAPNVDSGLVAWTRREPPATTVSRERGVHRRRRGVRPPPQGAARGAARARRARPRPSTRRWRAAGIDPLTRGEQLRARRLRAAHRGAGRRTGRPVTREGGVRPAHGDRPRRGQGQPRARGRAGCAPTDATRWPPSTRRSACTTTSARRRPSGGRWPSARSGEVDCSGVPLDEDNLAVRAGAAARRAPRPRPRRRASTSTRASRSPAGWPAAAPTPPPPWSRSTGCGDLRHARRGPARAGRAARQRRALRAARAAPPTAPAAASRSPRSMTPATTGGWWCPTTAGCRPRRSTASSTGSTPSPRRPRPGARRAARGAARRRRRRARRGAAQRPAGPAAEPAPELGERLALVRSPRAAPALLSGSGPDGAWPVRPLATRPRRPTRRRAARGRACRSCTSPPARWPAPTSWSWPR